MTSLNARCLQKLTGVHPDLVRVVRRTVELAPWGVQVLEGLRTVARQRQFVAAGASTTMHSRHLTGHAVDLGVVLPVEDRDGDGRDDDGIAGLRWDWPLYRRLGPLVLAAAQDLQVPIEWGGNWPHFADGPHFQLPWHEYPEAT